MMTLDKNLKETGFVNITDNYFDFHRSLFNPNLSEFDAFNKVHDDKLMEMHYQKKIHEFISRHSDAASPEEHAMAPTDPIHNRETIAESTQAETATANNRAGMTPMQLDLFQAPKILETAEAKATATSPRGGTTTQPSLKLLKTQKKKLRLKVQGNIYKKSRYQEANQQEQQMEKEEQNEMPEEMQMMALRANDDESSESTSQDELPPKTLALMKKLGEQNGDEDEAKNFKKLNSEQ